MELPAWIPVSVYAIIVLAFITFYVRNHSNEGRGRRLFILMLLLVIAQLLCNFLSQFYVYSWAPKPLVEVATYLDYLALPAIGVMWYQFVGSVLTSEERLGTRFFDHFIYGMAAVTVVVVASTMFTHWIFYFDGTKYVRGPLYFLPATITLICILFSEAFLISRARSLGRRSMTTLLFFPFPPIVGAILGLFTSNLPVMPLGISISMVVLFANFQTLGMNTDYLTNVNNRRRIEELLEERVDAARAGRPFAALMVDVDNFKKINDTLGHAVGDDALTETADLLKRCLRKGDMVGRYGGDEFFAIIDVANKHDLRVVIDRIRAEEYRFNDGTRPYTLQLSKGYAMFDPAMFDSAQAFETYLDQLMYADKQGHKEAAVVS